MTDVTSGPEAGTDAQTESTRERILAEAIEMFIRHGYHRTSLRTLADRLGITKAAILYHFPAKDRILIALMEPFVTALETEVERAKALPFPQRRYALLDGVLDAYFQNQKLLLMARADAAIFTQEETYQRFMRLPGLVIEVIVGPDAPLEDQVWAVQLMGTLGDSILFFGDKSPADLRVALQRGTMRLLAGGPPSQEPMGARFDFAWPDRNATLRPIVNVVHTNTSPPGSGRRVGRPRVLSGDRITRAKEMHASGRYNAEAIAAELGVSRATVYRYLN